MGTEVRHSQHRPGPCSPAKYWATSNWVALGKFLSLSLSFSFFYLFFETVSHYVTILPQSPSAGITDVPHHAWLFYFIFFNIAFYYWLKWFK
jgi:hypothetical protein